MEKMLEPGSWELTLFEKNAQFGGTWYENTYPGVACDIPSHDYNFTWDPKPDWSTFLRSREGDPGVFRELRRETWKQEVHAVEQQDRASQLETMRMGATALPSGILRLGSHEERLGRTSW